MYAESYMNSKAVNSIIKICVVYALHTTSGEHKFLKEVNQVFVELVLLSHKKLVNIISIFCDKVFKTNREFIDIIFANFAHSVNSNSDQNETFDSFIY